MCSSDLDEFECVGNVTGLGLNLAVDLVTDRESRGRDGETAARLLAFAMDRGVSFKLIQGNVLNLKPPLVISRGEIVDAKTIVGITWAARR